MLILAVIGRLLFGTLDNTVFALRRGIMKEKRTKQLPEYGSLLRVRLKQAVFAGSQLYGNFSYALMMTCIGILIILVAILLSVRAG